MIYLKEFQTQIINRDQNKFYQLWDEYKQGDLDVDELVALLKAIKNSDFAKMFGSLVESAIPLWEKISNPQHSYQVLSLLIDLETTNSQPLYDLALQAVTTKYGQEPLFQDKLKIVGLRNKDNFQGALFSFDLLMHMKKGNFVYHAGGWGTGEIMEVSPLREQLTIEFENVSGSKHIIFANAFKTLVPLQSNHFLVKRFAYPDQFEKEAKENPVASIKRLLKDIGPKNASEIKDEMCELVIPEKDWLKWWQNARAKMKKDPMINQPENTKDVFSLRTEAYTSKEKFEKTIPSTENVLETIKNSYSFLRDLPKGQDQEEIKKSVEKTLKETLQKPGLSEAETLQILLILGGSLNDARSEEAAITCITASKYPVDTIQAIDSAALKKRVCILIKEHRKDYAEIFVALIQVIQPSTMKEYLFKELVDSPFRSLLINFLEQVIRDPGSNPEFFLWYFSKAAQPKIDTSLPYSDLEGRSALFESFLILYNQLENRDGTKDLVKKMYNMLSGDRFALVRSLLENTSISFVQEFLLLVAKCHTLSDHDIKILRSLAAVVHPSLSSEDKSKKKKQDLHFLWTTEEGFLKTQNRAKEIGTVEMIENAKEIEAARALGDLRENSEYKFAQEKRARLQSELRNISQQIKTARILTPLDILSDEIGIGSRVEIQDPKGTILTYTILGPWDANPDKSILSFQSKLAETMMGCHVGDIFTFKDEDYKVVSISSFFDA